MHSFSHIICICIRVADAAGEVIYEVVAEPPEPLEQAQQEERCENQDQSPVDPAVEQQMQSKPRCTSYYFKFMTPKYVSITCALDLGIIWNPSCMIPRFP